MINDKMEVLDKEHESIPCLYVAGVVMSGSQGRDYTLYGVALGFSLFSGRFAGTGIAEYLNH